MAEMNGQDGLHSSSLSLSLISDLFAQVRDIASKYESRCDRSKVISKSYWNKDRAVAANAGAPAEGVPAAPAK